MEWRGSLGGSEATTSFLTPGGHGIPVAELLSGSGSGAGVQALGGRQVGFKWSTLTSVFVRIGLVARMEKFERFQTKIQNSSFFDKLRNPASLCPRC